MLTSLTQAASTFTLNTNWQFRKAGDTTWLPATVPGCVHTDLFDNKLIPDPFFAANEPQLQWIENEDWEYQTILTVDENLLRNDFIEIHFEGLDTYADVYINDILILKADNMFMSWKLQIKKYLQLGDNTLYIKFSSAVKTGKKLMASYPVKLPGEERVFTRKAQYQYGWDWGPRFVTAGIWKNIHLYAYGDNRLEDVNVGNIRFNKYTNTNGINVIFKTTLALRASNEYNLEIRDMDTGEKLLEEKTISGQQTITSLLYIKNPVFWWPAGYGEQHMYHYEITIRKGLKVIDRKNISFGIKKVELVESKDAAGKSFSFRINDTLMFMKGANIIPLHSFPSSLHSADYRNLLLEAKAMHINMLRVWGGGIYEDDTFYTLCDSLGILVWQDFMFACAMYPNEKSTTDYFDLIHAEASQQSGRLAQHPCITVFCGNNEVYEGWFNWGWQKTFNYSYNDSAFIWEQNQDIFETILPASIRSNGVYLPYIASSPQHGWGRKECLLEGDCHYWGVWWGKEPFEIFNKKVPRFMSEYGFQGMPSYHSFKQCIPANELQGTAQEILKNPSVKNHQKHPVGYETIQEYMTMYYKVPTDFEDYIYVSQLLQAKAMQTAIEAHRRNMPYCMGTLFWQLNDCWPVTSWSVLDFYGNRKASYYTAKEKYKDIILSVTDDKDSLYVHVISDKVQDVELSFAFTFLQTDGQTMHTGSYTNPVRIKKQSAAVIASLAKPHAYELNAYPDYIFYCNVLSGDTVIAEGWFTSKTPKDMPLIKPEINARYDAARNEIILTSKAPALNVYISADSKELKLSENFVHLLPGKEKRISPEEPFTLEDFQSLRFKTLNDINLKYK
jgi:beta-mannosidase